jgi:hypothetical protein
MDLIRKAATRLAEVQGVERVTRDQVKYPCAHDGRALASDTLSRGKVGKGKARRGTHTRTHASVNSLRMVWSVSSGRLGADNFDR